MIHVENEFWNFHFLKVSDSHTCLNITRSKMTRIIHQANREVSKFACIF